MHSAGHKHVTDVKLDSTVVFSDGILLLQGLLMLEEVHNVTKLHVDPRSLVGAC